MNTNQSVTRSITVDLSGTITQYNPTGHPNSLTFAGIWDDAGFVNNAQFQPTAVNEGIVTAAKWSYTASGLADGTYNFQIFAYGS